MYTMLATTGHLHTFLVVLLCALQVVDLVTTYFALATGRGHEANPLMQCLFDTFGWRLVLIMVKVFAVFLIVALAQRYGIANGILLILSALYTFVVYRNYLVDEGR